MNNSKHEAARSLSAVTMIVGLTLLGTSAGWAQQKAAASAKQLVGTWTLVSVNISFPDGKKVQPFGPNAQGHAFV